ncbi:hypothetical protein PS376_06735 [Limosilactobacillus pontis]
MPLPQAEQGQTSGEHAQDNAEQGTAVTGLWQGNLPQLLAGLATATAWSVWTVAVWVANRTAVGFTPVIFTVDFTLDWLLAGAEG